MFIDVEQSGTIRGLKQAVSQAVGRGAKGLMILACDANGFTAAQLDPVLKEVTVPLFGGIFPEILYRREKRTIGTALMAFETIIPIVRIIENISHPSTDIAAALRQIEDVAFQTMFAYIDAFSTTIETVINELYYEFGLDNNFIGGGAGSLSFEQKPVILTNQGLLQDAVVLAQVDKACSIGVKHGWQTIAGPFQVTDARNNHLKALDYQPAVEIYKKAVEKDSGRCFADHSFFDIAKGYPFGISKIDSEKVVRDPIALAQDSLVLVGNVRTGDYVYILNGNKTSLVKAAQRAYDEAQKGCTKTEGAHVLFIDCISRVLFLEDHFKEELNAVAARNDNLIGALTLGEIANTGKEYLEFYNKTAVVGVF